MADTPTIEEIRRRWGGNMPYAPPYEICKRDIDFLLAEVDRLKAELENEQERAAEAAAGEDW